MCHIIASVTRINTQLGLPHKIEELRLIRPLKPPIRIQKRKPCSEISRDFNLCFETLGSGLIFLMQIMFHLRPLTLLFQSQAASNEVIDLEKNTSNERSVEVLLSAFRPLARPKNSAVERVGNSDLQSVAVIVPEIDKYGALYVVS